MNTRRALRYGFVFFLLMTASAARAGNDIPKAAWKRPIGAPLEHPGTKKTSAGCRPHR